MGLVPDGPGMRQRPVVVCLHGGPGLTTACRSRIWRRWLMWRSWYCLITVATAAVTAARRSGGISIPGSMTYLAFGAALEIERPILPGQSFGSYVALGVAACYTELAGKLIVSSGTGRIRFDPAAVPGLVVAGMEHQRPGRRRKWVIRWLDVVLTLRSKIGQSLFPPVHWRAECQLCAVACFDTSRRRAAPNEPAVRQGVIADALSSSRRAVARRWDPAVPWPRWGSRCRARPAPPRALGRVTTPAL